MVMGGVGKLSGVTGCGVLSRRNLTVVLRTRFSSMSMTLKFDVIAMKYSWSLSSWCCKSSKLYLWVWPTRVVMVWLKVNQ